MLNLSSLLEDSARNYPDRDALVLGAQRLNYGQVNAQANRVANLLVARGIQPGDRVALSCPNLPAFPIIYHGILKAGAVVVPMNVLLKSGEIAYHLNDAAARAYFCFEGTPDLPMAAEGHAALTQAPSVRDFFVVTADPAASGPIAGAETLAQALAAMPGDFDSVVTEATDTAVILYTSGTTGQPKGAELTHANLMMNTLAANRLFGNLPARDTHLICLPLFHSFGATVHLHCGFSTAATLHLLPRFDAAQAVKIMESNDITYFAGVPTMWWGLLQALGANVDVGRIADRLRLGISGGSAMAVELTRQISARLGVTVLEGYGLSETSPVATFSRPGEPPREGSIGVPIWGVEAKLIDADWNDVTAPGEVGEIAIKGPNVMKGYLNRPEATAAVIRDGWFRTGDLARQDADGYFYVIDRTKDMIIRGGFNVYPREIEEVLLTHPAISMAAVIGVPQDSHGEEIKAFIILQAGAEADPAEIIAWSKARMAAYKYPRIVEIVAALPMTATGKILKRELK
ncbi:long-chain fatty acid--CoA ligase [Paracoccus sp. S1E-3]|uniref:long-chain-fatty-acid--CoA ligase n=1 Tax=Paracoccus sp. S1E-3 TaxID=2756130 RepID=UPI0015EFD2ED|nr:long-chain fatty acid--CoA ligase [Paracoccus sp. S1E-3]MBA4491785.1 long-chain fatty acid--CoA ligase [Paracoccus sp. S1E-3]